MSYKVDYVVWEQEFNLQKPDYLNRAAHPVWSSESGDVAVLKLDRERALTEFCGS